jgi:two-component system nitrogen regulation response regulator GlnG
LVVDDEPAICWGLSRLGETLGHDVTVASSAEHGLQIAAGQRPDLLVLDVRLPGIDGLSAMKSFRAVLAEAPIIVITAFGDLATAVKAVGQGAFEYVLKPFDLQEIRAAIERALHAAPPHAVTRTAVGVDGMLGRSPAMQAVFKRIALAAASDAAVLLTGESGVGKELAAQAIHRHSARGGGPFVAVNMAALSPALAEAELFGHVAGAFTGAQQARKGLLVQADEGTLFIDEVADIPPAVQVKLLRALDQGEVLPVGADQPIESRFRVVSATHQDLHQKVGAGGFRHDL